MKKPRDETVFDRLKKNRSAMAALAVLSCFVLVSVFADLIAPYENGINQNAAIRLTVPSAAHPFGTDGFGRDEFARVVHGARLSLFLGLASIGLSMSIALILGSAAGYFGGRLDEIIMRVMDTVLCIPSILLSLAIVSVLGP
jgi:peptide/nickel transport system permease protein